MGRRIKTASELANTVVSWEEARPKRPRTRTRAQATLRRVYTEMSKFPSKTIAEVENADCLWLEDNTQAGSEPGQYKTTIGDIYQPCIDNFAFSAYGGMQLDNPTFVPWHDIALAHRKIDVFDVQSVTTQRHISTDLVNSTVAIDIEGVYNYAVTLSFEHNEVNQSRQTYVRFWNTNAGAPVGSDNVIGTARNQGASLFTIAGLLEITSALLNTPIEIQIGGGSTYTAVVWNIAQFTLNGVGELRSNLTAQPV